jgi:ornithine cyclodeaminase/alanine dehydrogenase-like protein (mu-crystallin family)
MRVVSAAEIDAALSFPALIAALADAFRADIVVPVRHHHEISRPGRATATHLLMPAWTAAAEDGFLGAKIVNVFPDNGAKGLPSIYGTYLLMSGETGETLAAMDGTRLTAWRTAAASALAASHLAREDAADLLMVGAGALAPFLIRAHAAVRPIRRVTLWNRDPAKCAPLRAAVEAEGLSCTVAGPLEAAVRAADIVSCATLSKEPLVRGAWLRPGTHLDLVGAYSPAMRESDDEAVRRARIFVDTRAGALKEGGDIVQPLADGVITRPEIEGDLFDLCRGTIEVDRKPDDVTLFKSVGTAIEDLAAAMLVWRSLQRAG